MVEDYIKQSIGPRAVLTDMAKTAKVIARFGPRLPGLVEAALIRQAGTQDQGDRRSRWPLVAAGLAGVTLGVAGTLAATLLG